MTMYISRQYSLIPILLFLAITFTAAAAVSETGKEISRGLSTIRIQDADSKFTEVELYRGSHALIIGASKYNNGWPVLPGVIDDVAAVKKKLEENGFTVNVVMDPDAVKLKDSFENFIAAHGNESLNRLLFYFAGHGHTLQPAYGGDPIGYIVPIDAPLASDDADDFKRKAMSMQRIEEFARLIDSKHAMFLFDSCFSGSIFALSRATPVDISYKITKPVRQFITSGGEDEQVSDESIFRMQFIAGLNGEADANRDGYVTGSELGAFLQSSVINYSKGYQHPQYGKIRHPQLDKGDFVFAVDPGQLAATAEVSSHQGRPLHQPQRATSSGTPQYDIKKLALQYKNSTIPSVPEKDTWTRAQSIVMVFIDVEGSGTSVGERNYILDNTSEKMRESGRFRVVEREILDKLIAELQLSNSDLADPATALRLGKVLAASLIATGSVNKQEKDWLVSLRFIDTETTSVRSSVSKILMDSDPQQVADSLGEMIETKLTNEFPLQGKILSIKDATAVINIGSKSGVKKDMAFEILDDDDIPIAEILVEKVGKGKSHAKMGEQASQLTSGMRIRELANDE